MDNNKDKKKLPKIIVIKHPKAIARRYPKRFDLRNKNNHIIKFLEIFLYNITYFHLCAIISPKNPPNGSNITRTVNIVILTTHGWCSNPPLGIRFDV